MYLAEIGKLSTPMRQLEQAGLVVQPTLGLQDSTAAESEVTLIAEQQHVVDLVLEGRNVCYTGSAGCGKSAILKACKKQLGAGSEKRPPKRVSVVASTNLAAFAVGGHTFFNYAGWSLSSGRDSLEVLEKHAHKKKAWARFVQTDVLIIDEISKRL